MRHIAAGKYPAVMNMHDRALERRRKLLLVDESVCSRLVSALEERGFNVAVCHNGEQAIQLMKSSPPEYVVTDLKLPDLSGLTLISKLKAVAPHTNIVVLTGHSSIATAVEAIKLGATHYLAKPADVDQIVTAFDRGRGDDSVPVNGKPLSVQRLEWEYINRVLMENAGNISATARALSMHRRTLQRKLHKRATER